uniref:Uncharacterized protein n=1 Tax=Strongyloides papillosus TaxID=174720 RepID=A0A0N5CFP9_STREA
MSDAEVQNLLRSSSSRTSSESSEDSSIVAGSGSGSNSTSSSEVILISSDSEESPTSVEPGVSCIVNGASNGGSSPGPSGVAFVAVSQLVAPRVPSLVAARRFDSTKSTFKLWISRLMQTSRRPVVMLDGSFETERRRIIRKRTRNVSPCDAFTDQEKRLREEYIHGLNENTRTLESQVLLTAIGEVSNHPIARHMLMEVSSVKLFNRFNDAPTIDDYRILSYTDRNCVKIC